MTDVLTILAGIDIILGVALWLCLLWMLITGFVRWLVNRD